MPKKKSDLTDLPNILNTDNEISILNNNKTNTSIIEDDIIDISKLRGKEIWHYSMLEKFFSLCELTQIQKMIDIINGNHLISLRFLDWFVTRYCYLYKNTINISNQFCKQNNFNINISYKAQLKSFTKKYFDPFKRKKKFYFVFDNIETQFLTTIGQLNFFRWAITNDIITFTEINYRTIVLNYDHVNSFFKKHILRDSISLSTGTNQTSETTTTNDATVYSQINNTSVVIEEKKKTNTKQLKILRNISLEL
jgi:hypothetical protein